MKRTTIYWHKTGPLVQYIDGALMIDDLNPQVSTKWRMSRWEMIKFAWRSLFVALIPQTPKENE